MKKCIMLVCAVAMVVGLAGSASALTIGTWESRDDDVFGTDSITYDSATGLEWLDFSLTSGNSYERWTELMNRASGSYSGFRWATESEVKALFGTYADNTQYAPGSDGYNAILNVQEMFGFTTVMYERRNPRYTHYMQALVRQDWAMYRERSRRQWESTSGLSAAIVRVASPNTPVPEPGTLISLGVGLIGLVVLRRKYRR